MDPVSALSGGIVGVVGSVATGITGWLTQRSKKDENIQLAKIEAQSKKDLAEISIRQFEAESAAKVKVATAEAEAEVSKGEIEAFKSSYTEASTAYSKGHAVGKVGKVLLPIIDFIRGSQRPLVIYTLLTVSIILVFRGHEQMLNSIDFMTMSAVGWLFGARTTEKLFNSINGK